MAKGIYAGGSSNLVGNGDFNDGMNGWENAGTRTEASVEHGSLKVAMTNPSTSPAYGYVRTNITIIEGHVYYLTCLIKGQTGNANLKACISLDDGRSWTGNRVDSSAEDWQRSSLYVSEANAGIGGVLCHQLVGSSDGTIKAGMTLNFDDVRAYDLTALYGAGNEPTQEWCDANLEALDNKGVARKVKKAYVGAGGNLVVNGDFGDGLNGWALSDANGGNVTLANKDGYTCIDLYRNSTSVGAAYFGAEQELNLDVSNHKVYISGHVRGEASNVENTVILNLNYSKDSINYAGGKSIESGTILEEWTQASLIYDFSNTTTTITSIRCAVMQNATGAHVYWRDICLYDLTALYGAGNEPTQEWCDANVEALAKKSVAHKIQKGYIGVGGVARLFFSTEKVLSYYGTATDLSSAKYDLAATSVGDYALFAGGNNNSGVDTYTSALVKGTATSLAKGRPQLAATSVGDYALFAGGYYSSTWYNNVDTYTSTLTKGTATTLGQTRGRLAATTVGDYALFGGGYKSGGASTSVDSYTSALVKGSTTLSVARQYLAATTVGNFALFGGGTSDDDYEATVDGFNASKVRITVTALSIQRQQLAATTVGNYALFGGGKTSSTRANVDTYTSSLVKGTATDLSSARAQLAATTVGDYAIFAGGVSSAIVDTYTSSLVKGTATDLSNARGQLAATTIGNYALFGGGNRSASAQKKVDVYQLVES